MVIYGFSNFLCVVITNRDSRIIQLSFTTDSNLTMVAFCLFLGWLNSLIALDNEKLLSFIEFMIIISFTSLGGILAT